MITKMIENKQREGKNKEIIFCNYSLIMSTGIIHNDFLPSHYG